MYPSLVPIISQQILRNVYGNSIQLSGFTFGTTLSRVCGHTHPEKFGLCK